MAVQQNNIMLLDALGFPRVIDTGNDTLEIGVGTTFGGDLGVAGDLTVQGDIVSRGQVDVIFQDAFLDLGFPSAAPGTTANSGGFTVQMNRNSGFTKGTVTDFTAGGAGGPTFTYTDDGTSSLLVAGDIVAISGAADSENDGYFVVDSVDQAAFPQVVTIKGTGGTAVDGSVPFCQSQYKAATGDSADAYKVDVAAVALADGTTSFKDGGGTAWPKGTFVTAYHANATVADFNANAGWDALSSVSLQEAYVVGNVITTSGAEGDVQISGDQKLIVDASGGVQIDNGVLDVNSSVDVDLTGGFAVDGAQAIAFGSAAQVSSYSIDTSGAFSVLADSASSVRVDGANLTMQTATSGDIITNSVGDYDILAITMDANLSGALEIDAAAASNITVAGADLALSTTTSGEIDLTSAGLMDMNAGAGMDIDVTGAFDMLSSGAFSIDGTGASNMSATSGNLTLSSITSGNVVVASAADVDIDGANITADATAGISLDAAAASNFTVAGADLDLATTGSGNIDIQSAGNVDVDGGAIQINGTAGSHFEVEAADLIIGSNTSGKLQLKAAGLLDIDAGANADIDVTGNVEVDATGLISLDGVGNSNLTTDSGNLTLSTSTSGNIAVQSSGDVDVDGANILMDATAAISLDSATTSNFRVNGSGQSLALEALGGGAQQLILDSAGTGADAIRLNAAAGGLDLDAASDIAMDAAGSLSMQAGGISDLTMSGNAGSDLGLTLEAANAGAGTGSLLLKASDNIIIGDAGTYATADIELQHYTEFKQSGGFKLNAGETLAQGDAVMIKYDGVNTEPRLYKAANNAGADDERVVYGVAATAGNAGDQVSLASLQGTMVITGLSGLASSDVGKRVYLAVGGAMTLTAPTASGTSVFRCGYVSSHNGGPGGKAMMVFSPQFIAKRP
jgi:hypothetical protein